MDFNVSTQDLNVAETVFEGRAEQAVDSDVTLPDYYPDILRILKCGIMPSVTSTQSTGDRVSFDGTALVRIIYVGEDNRIHCYEQGYPFSKYVEAKEITDTAAVFIKPKTDYANCRAVNQRRIDIHGMVTFNVRAVNKRTESILMSADGAGIQLLCGDKETASLTAVAVKQFSMSEVAETGSKPPVTQIVHSTAFAIADDIKSINNKLLIKGELTVNILYCSDDADGELVTFEHTMPISQIIEADGVTDETVNCVDLTVCALDLSLKTDSDGKQTMIDISAVVSAYIRAYTVTDLPVVTDAYSICCELNTEYRRMDLMQMSENIRDRMVARGNMDLSGAGIEKILDARCGAVTSSVSAHGRELVLNGSVTVNLLYLDKENQYGCAERQMDYEYRRELKNDIDKLKCEPAVVVTGCTASAGADGKIEVRAELSIGMTVFSCTSERVITQIEPDETKPKRGKKSAVTIYFSECGEAVWNIARHYNTTTDAIMQENNLTDDEIPAKCMLIIPGV